MVEQWDAVVLAGGRSSRFGTDKLASIVAGRSLLDHALAAVAEARQTIVVGPRRATGHIVTWVREEPPGSGPAMAVAAALTDVQSDVVVVLAADQLDLVSRVGAVLDSVAGDGAVLVHDDHVQWLLAAYRTRSLRDLEPPRPDDSMRGWVAPLRLARAPDPVDAPLDVDTHADLRAARLASGTVLEDWVRELAELLGVDPTVVDVEAVLDLAREAAHGVSRPAAPVSTFLAGYAAGGGDAAAVQAILERATALARQHDREG